MKREYSIIKVGIVGLGNIGKKRLSALKKIKRYKIVISFIIDKNEINDKKLEELRKNFLKDSVLVTTLDQV